MSQSLDTNPVNDVYVYFSMTKFYKFPFFVRREIQLRVCFQQMNNNNNKKKKKETQK